MCKKQILQIFQSTIVVLSLTFGVANAAEKNELVLNYDGFFDRMDDLVEPEYQDIKLAFYFMTQSAEPCPIKSVSLQTQLKKMEVYSLASGEILLPFDEQLDADKASIIIEKLDDELCGLDMRLESSILFEQAVTINKAISLVNTFDLALDDLAGMMSFTLPNVVGVTFKAKQGEMLNINSGLKGECNQHACTITLDELQKAEAEQIHFSHTIVKAVPFIN